MGGHLDGIVSAGAQGKREQLKRGGGVPIVQGVTLSGYIVNGNQHTEQCMVIWVNNFQTELMVKIYSTSPARAIGKVLLMEFSKNID